MARVSPSPARKARSAASSAGSAEPSSPECGFAWKLRPSHGTPAESAWAPWAWSCGPSVSGDIQRLGQGELARVERLADDRALDTQRNEVSQIRDVVEARDAAGSDDRLGGALRHLAQQLGVGAAQRAVLRDVGDDVAA